MADHARPKIVIIEGQSVTGKTTFCKSKGGYLNDFSENLDKIVDDVARLRMRAKHLHPICQYNYANTTERQLLKCVQKFTIGEYPNKDLLVIDRIPFTSFMFDEIRRIERKLVPCEIELRVMNMIEDASEMVGLKLLNTAPMYVFGEKDTSVLLERYKQSGRQPNYFNLDNTSEWHEKQYKWFRVFAHVTGARFIELEGKTVSEYFQVNNI